MNKPNALNQYLALYRENAAAIDAHSGGTLNALRPAALEALEREGRLPEKGDERYEKTSVNEMFLPDYGVNVNRVGMPVAVGASFRCGVPNLSTLMAVVVNDRFVPTATLLKNLPEGLTVCSLAEAANSHPGLIERY